MGVVFGCLKEPSTNQIQKIFRKKINKSEEENKSASTPITDTSDEEGVNVAPDPKYFEKLAILLNTLPRKHRLQTDEMINIVKRNPRFAPQIISLVLFLESENVRVEAGMLSMLTQRGQIAKEIRDAILLLKTHKIVPDQTLLLELLSNATSVEKAAQSIITRKQKRDMHLLFKQLHLEKKQMDRQLEIGFLQLEIAEKKTVSHLVAQLANEKPIVAPLSLTPTSSSSKKSSTSCDGDVEEYSISFFPPRNNTLLPPSPLLTPVSVSPTVSSKNPPRKKR